MTELMNIALIFFGSMFYQLFFLIVFSESERKKLWFGWTVVTESLLFGIVLGFSNEYIFWISEVGLAVGMLILVYTISEKEFLPKKINKLIYFYPTLPKIKLR